jgi:hypothetical protein
MWASIHLVGHYAPVTLVVTECSLQTSRIFQENSFLFFHFSQTWILSAENAVTVWSIRDDDFRWRSHHHVASILLQGHDYCVKDDMVSCSFSKGEEMNPYDPRSILCQRSRAPPSIV